MMAAGMTVKKEAETKLRYRNFDIMELKSVGKDMYGRLDETTYIYRVLDICFTNIDR